MSRSLTMILSTAHITAFVIEISFSLSFGSRSAVESWFAPLVASVANIELKCITGEKFHWMFVSFPNAEICM